MYWIDNELNLPGKTASIYLKHHVDDSVKEHEEDAPSHVEVIVRHGASANVGPLNTNSLFLKAGNVATPKTERYCRRQALQTEIVICLDMYIYDVRKSIEFYYNNVGEKKIIKSKFFSTI